MSHEAVTVVFDVRKRKPSCPQQLVEIRTASCRRRELEEKGGSAKEPEEAVSLFFHSQRVGNTANVSLCVTLLARSGKLRI